MNYTKFNIDTNYDLKISINDENGFSTSYKLGVNINNLPLSTAKS